MVNYRQLACNWLNGMFLVLPKNHNFFKVSITFSNFWKIAYSILGSSMQVVLDFTLKMHFIISQEYLWGWQSTTGTENSLMASVIRNQLILFNQEAMMSVTLDMKMLKVFFCGRDQLSKLQKQIQKNHTLGYPFKPLF